MNSGSAPLGICNGRCGSSLPRRVKVCSGTGTARLAAFEEEDQKERREHREPGPWRATLPLPYGCRKRREPAVTAHPSGDTGPSPQPKRRGPNHAFSPTMGEVRMAPIMPSGDAMGTWKPATRCPITPDMAITETSSGSTRAQVGNGTSSMAPSGHAVTHLPHSWHRS